MVRDGLMERFGIQEVYGMHNMPGMAIGAFAIRPGPIMASADSFKIVIEGKGGHAARAHETIDPIVVASHVITALQTVTSRNVDPLESSVISVCTVRSGDAYNVIPQTATLLGTARALKADVRDLIEARLRTVTENVCAAFGATAQVEYERGYPVTVNDPEKTAFMARVASDVAGANAVDAQTPPLMGGEDFSYMLEKRPGAYIFIGNGDTASVHHPAYDFNDEAAPFGVSLWAKIVETGMPAR
jgi:hippurate hydrolase